VLLYSVNPRVKLLIQREFLGDVHYVWCSERFDSATASPYTRAGLVPPTSNPKQIYRDLKEACDRRDKHNDKIVSMRAGCLARAEAWLAAGDITANDRDEIVYLVTQDDFELWRPVLYLIPRNPVEARLKPVPPAKRAGVGPEYIIEELAAAEFETMEF
jgi:hypothetical protein